MSNDSELCVIIESDCQKAYETVLNCVTSLEVLTEACDSKDMDVTLFRGPLILLAQALATVYEAIDPSDLVKVEREFSFAQRALLLKEIEQLKDKYKRAVEAQAERYRELRIVEQERDFLKGQLRMATME